MEAVRTSETLVNLQLSTHRYCLENSHLHNCIFRKAVWSLKNWPQDHFLIGKMMTPGGSFYHGHIFLISFLKTGVRQTLASTVVNKHAGYRRQIITIKCHVFPAP
jgi:hypothetical protein